MSIIMKKIIKKIFPKSLLEKTLSLYYRDRMFFYDKEFINYIYNKKKGLVKSCHEIETLVVRGSNADFGFDPSLFPNSYNLGLTSTDLYSTYYIYQSVNKRMPNLKNIIIYLNPASIGFELGRTREKYRLFAYKYFFDVPIVYDLSNLKIEKKVLLSSLKVKNKDEEYLNMSNGYVAHNGCHENYKANERVRTHLRENKREPDQINWLKSLVEAIEREGKKAYLVITPMRSDYKDLMPDENEIYKKIFNEFDSEIILNFYNDNDFDDMDMFDTDHLNDTGAKKLTKKIYKRLMHDLEF